MRVVFNGSIEKSEGGCGVCGHKKVGKNVFVRTRLYSLPSGRQVTFRAGVPVEVSEADGNFLLSYVEKDSNGLRKTFSKA